MAKMAKFCLQIVSFILVGFFNMPQIYNMGLTALLSLKRKSCYGFLSPLKSDHPWQGLDTVAKHATARPPRATNCIFKESLQNVLIKSNLTSWFGLKFRVTCNKV
jgi:hypothetical protein